MTERQTNAGPRKLDPLAEMRRIRTTGALSLVLTALALLLDGPISILAWLLMGVALLSMLYVVLAARALTLYFRSQDHKAEHHEQ